MQTTAVDRRDPLDIPQPVKVGQLIEITGDGECAGYTLRLWDEDIMRVMNPDAETTVALLAQCQQCHFSAEVDADDDQSGFEFRCWNHEQDHPGHVIGYRTETVRWWE